MTAFAMIRRANQLRVLLFLVIAWSASAALAQVRGVPIHTGGTGIGPLGGGIGGANIPRDPLGTSLKVENLTPRSLEPIKTPDVVTAAPAPEAARSSDEPATRVASLPSYTDEYSNASGSPPPPPEEPTDGDDGGDDDDDDEDEDEEEDEEQVDVGEVNEVYSLDSGETQEQSPQPAPAPKKFPWGRVVVGVIVTICVLGYFSRND
jgi:hypothetical protein